jgi:acetoin utilization protein AcuC
MRQTLPASVRDINRLPWTERLAVYRQLVPDDLLERYNIPPDTLEVEGESMFEVLSEAGGRGVEISIYPYPKAQDPLIYFNMIDTFNQRLMVLLVVINDPTAPRFNTDRMPDGSPTHFGTGERNLAEEKRAMEAGLGPGQVRRGLRSFKTLVPRFEDFVGRMGHDLFLIEPLAYHNALAFERYGFAYVRGQAEMEQIHFGFMPPDGDYYQQLDAANPFRPLDAWRSIRGRSWAIHDGILGRPFDGFQMYKRLGVHAGVNTVAGWEKALDGRFFSV